MNPNTTNQGERSGEKKVEERRRFVTNGRGQVLLKSDGKPIPLHDGGDQSSAPVKLKVDWSQTSKNKNLRSSSTSTAASDTSSSDKSASSSSSSSSTTQMTKGSRGGADDKKKSQSKDAWKARKAAEKQREKDKKATRSGRKRGSRQQKSSQTVTRALSDCVSQLAAARDALRDKRNWTVSDSELDGGSSGSGPSTSNSSSNTPGGGGGGPNQPGGGGGGPGVHGGSGGDGDSDSEFEPNGIMGFALPTERIPQSPVVPAGYVIRDVQWITPTYNGTLAQHIVAAARDGTLGDAADVHNAIKLCAKKGLLNISSLFSARAGDVRPATNRAAALLKAHLMTYTLAPKSTTYGICALKRIFNADKLGFFSTLGLSMAGGFSVASSLVFEPIKTQRKGLIGYLTEMVNLSTRATKNVLLAGGAFALLGAMAKMTTLLFKHSPPVMQVAPVLVQHANHRMGNDRTTYDSVMRAGTSIFSTLGSLNIPADTQAALYEGSLSVASMTWNAAHPSDPLDFLMSSRVQDPESSPYTPGSNEPGEECGSDQGSSPPSSPPNSPPIKPQSPPPDIPPISSSDYYSAQSSSSGSDSETESCASRSSSCTRGKSRKESSDESEMSSSSQSQSDESSEEDSPRGAPSVDESNTKVDALLERMSFRSQYPISKPSVLREEASTDTGTKTFVITPTSSFQVSLPPAQQTDPCQSQNGPVSRSTH